MRGQGQTPIDAPGLSRRALESLMAFWADAGVDTSYEDAPVDRLAQPARAPRPPQQAQATERGPLLPAAAPQGPAQGRAQGPAIAAAIAEARRLAAGCETLEALAAAIAGFDGCGLKFEGARQAVFARGEPHAPVMVIGEGPGGDEDIQGLPFFGRAGKLLDKMLGAAGLTGRVFITNTVYWRPPGNRTPTPQEQAVCLPFLERSIALTAPKLLLLAGGASAKALLKTSDGILSLRGRWFDWSSSDGTMSLPAMPTLHPAFLLRQPGAKKRAWTDMLMLAERLDRPGRPG